ncbi:MAG: hypothetical protein ACOC2H_07070 [Spirochaetota bacterium]
MCLQKCLPVLLTALAAVVLLNGCSQRGPVTHEQAYAALQEVYSTGNNSYFTSLLSHNSIRYVRKISLAISRLEGKSKDHMAKKFGLKTELLENMSPNGYLKLYLALNSSHSKDIIAQSLENAPVEVLQNGDHVCYRMPNNVVLYFIQEKPYWKFDLERTVR